MFVCGVVVVVIWGEIIRMGTLFRHLVVVVVVFVLVWHKNAAETYIQFIIRRIPCANIFKITKQYIYKLNIIVIREIKKKLCCATNIFSIK